MDNTFFSRPQPKCIDKIIERQSDWNDNFNYLGQQIPLFNSHVSELWINVTNHGKTSVKRMRARAKLYPIPKKPRQLSDRERPKDISDEEWNFQKRQHETFIAETELARSNKTYGTPLPFSKTPKGTIGLPWTQVDQTTYETDLTPLSDEASAKLVTAYRLDDHVVKELSKRQLIITSEGEQIGILAVGNDLMVLLNVTNDQKIEHEFAIKFWIVAEKYYKRSFRDSPC